MQKLFSGILFLLVFSFPVFAANYSSLDKRALNTPIELEADIPTLVAYLIDGLDTEEERARVIASWIAYHVDYDDYKYNKMIDRIDSKKRDFNIPDSKDAFYTRKGTCRDFAELFYRMAKEAHLYVEIVEGFLKKQTTTYRDREKSAHCWNVVGSRGEWQLLDLTQAATGNNLDENINTDKSYDRKIERSLSDNENFRRKVSNAAKRKKTLRDDDKWFFVKPNDMIKDHLPDDDFWQLKTPPTSKERFFRN